MTADAPRYQHDCDRCTFLGQFGSMDLYFCPQMPSSPTLIARYGAGPDYKSGLLLADLDEDLSEARARARGRGLLPAVPAAPTDA